MFVKVLFLMFVCVWLGISKVALIDDSCSTVEENGRKHGEKCVSFVGLGRKNLCGELNGDDDYLNELGSSQSSS